MKHLRKLPALILQTIVFPLPFLWLGYRILSAAATLPTPTAPSTR